MFLTLGLMLPVAATTAAAGATYYWCCIRTSVLMQQPDEAEAGSPALRPTRHLMRYNAKSCLVLEH